MSIKLVSRALSQATLAATQAADAAALDATFDPEIDVTAYFNPFQRGDTMAGQFQNDAPGLGWTSTPPAIVFTDGAGNQDFPFAPYLSSPDAAVTALDPSSTESNLVPKALPPQLSLPAVIPPVLRFTDTGAVETYGPVNFKWGVTATAAADWAARIAGTDVVWYHDFTSNAEVDAFRWANARTDLGSWGGNDPTDVANPGTCVRDTTDGITGACLKITRPAGSVDNRHSAWWRPLNPFAGIGGQDDPAASDSVTRRAWNPTQGGSQTATWHYGLYGHSSFHPSEQGFNGAAGTYFYDGDEYYFQMRIKVPATLRLNAAGSPDGKLCYFTRTNNSNTSQEVNTEAIQFGNYQTGVRNYFSMYRSGSDPLEGDTVPYDGHQPGSDLGFCDFNSSTNSANCWYWPEDEWVTVQYRLKLGTGEGGANNDTLIQVFVARLGESSYTKIWDQADADLPFDNYHGQNGVLFNGYMNNNNYPLLVFKYCQLIFSKSTIPCPKV